MKNSLKITALVLLAATGLFAAVPAKAATTDVPSVITLESNKSIAVKAAGSKSVVMIYDQDKNILRKDVLAGNASKGYVLNALENGDYVLEITSNNQTVKKNIHVYNEDKVKTFIVQE